VKALISVTRTLLRSKTTKIFIVSTVLMAAAYHWTQHAHIEAIEMFRFRAHRGDYEILLTMLQQDKNLTFVNEGLTLPADPATIGISPARIVQYRRILSRLGRGSLGYVPALGTAFFGANSFGDDDILFFPIRSSAFAARYGLPLDRPPMQSHHIEDDVVG
jgi:hypothetical protein